MPARHGPNRRATETTLKALRAAGRLEPVDAAHEQLVRSLADAVDASPENAALWKQYREALADMRKPEDDDGGLEAALASIRGAAAVGDT